MCQGHGEDNDPALLIPGWGEPNLVIPNHMRLRTSTQKRIWKIEDTLEILKKQAFQEALKAKEEEKNGKIQIKLLFFVIPEILQMLDFSPSNQNIFGIKWYEMKNLSNIKQVQEYESGTNVSLRLAFFFDFEVIVPKYSARIQQIKMHFQKLKEMKVIFIGFTNSNKISNVPEAIQSHFEYKFSKPINEDCFNTIGNIFLSGE